MGAGIVVVLPDSSCGLAETARVIRYLADENAGQCGPCMFGLPALADAMADLAYQGGRGRAATRSAATPTGRSSWCAAHWGPSRRTCGGMTSTAPAPE